VTAGKSSNISVLLGLPGGEFSDQVRYSRVGNDTRQIALGDMNGDTLLDIVATGGDGVQILLNNGSEVHFLRGDANSDGALDVSDAISILGYLFLGKDRPPVLDAADCNDDGMVDISDVIFFLICRFTGEDELPPPYPDAGLDPTFDDL